MRKITEKQKKTCDAFLEGYKELEKIVFDVENCSVYELEAKLGQESEESGRLRMCRMMRNFLSHNDSSDAFVVPTPAMIAFLEEETEKEKRKKKTAGEASRRVSPVYEGDPLQEAARRLARMPFVPVTDEDGVLVGVITPESVCAVYAKSPLNARTKAGVAVVKCMPVLSDVPAEDVGESCVVADASGKYRGIIVLKKE
jgi:hypothetical protein